MTAIQATLSDELRGAPALAGAVSGAISALVERSKPSVVQVRGRRGGGTGVIWRADGAILTNHHVVASTPQLNVLLHDGRSFEARVAASSPELDLALLEVDARDLPAAPVDDSNTLRVGELALALGHPWGQRWVTTAGIVSGLGSLPVAGGRSAPFIRSDVHLAPGNSGGPLLNARGAVVGINAMVFGGDLAVAIPSHVAITWVAGLPSHRVALGIQVQTVELPAALRQGRLAARRSGVLVVGVKPHGLAERADVLVGDVLVEVGDAPVESTAALLEALARRDATAIVRLGLLRGGALHTIDVPIAEPA